MSNFLIGAKAIGRKLIELGLLEPEADDAKLTDRVYYLARSEKLKIDDRFGDQLITTTEKLQRQISKLVS